MVWNKVKLELWTVLQVQSITGWMQQQNKWKKLKINIHSCIYATISYARKIFREIYFLFFSNWKEYDLSDSFPFDWEPTGISFVS